MKSGDGGGQNDDPYEDRLQTKVKHVILKGYLQELAYKVLTFKDLTYVDGFSGPWNTETENFADSSFMIAIEALQQAQADMLAQGTKRKIRLFLSERDPKAYAKLQTAVAPYNKPAEGFEIITYGGEFENAISQIERYVGTSFSLIFIDPTGWTGFGFDKIKSLFQRPSVEVLINFMYAFVSRFVNDDRPEIIASLDPILGGPGWRERLDATLPRGLAVEKLFRETLKSAGNFRYVISTRIDKSTENRPHFFLVYGTKAQAGLKAFRETEFKGLRGHARDRANAKDKKRTEKTGMHDLFAGQSADDQEASLEDMVEEQKRLATNDLLATLELRGAFPFEEVVAGLLQAYMLRETDVKDICVALANAGKVENTWGSKPRKPKDGNLILLAQKN